VELYSDLNNDGQLTSADSGLTGSPYASGATNEQKDKGTEFMFKNDNMSNGAWDKGATGAPASANDDDAEEIVIKPGITEGEVWLDHPAIAGLKFYDSAQCTTELPLKPTNKFTLGSRAWPEHIFVRADGTINFPATDPQNEGDLKLMVKPTGAGAAIEAAKMKLTIVEKLGATKHHRAALDYIYERNATHYTQTADYDGLKVPFVVMSEPLAELQGINAKVGTLEGITAVAGSASWKDCTAIINATYTYDETNDGGFYKLHDGELVHGSAMDATCSVKNAVSGSPRHNYVASRGVGVFAWAAGDVHHTATEGTGGMAIAGPNVQPFTAISRIIVDQDKLVYVASHYSEFWNSAPYTKYETDLKKGITSSTLYLCDGGSSSALSVIKPDASAHEIKMQGPRHNPPTWNPITFLKSASTLYLKTYIGIKTNKPRP
jgi:hypothetical protein